MTVSHDHPDEGPLVYFPDCPECRRDAKARNKPPVVTMAEVLDMLTNIRPRPSGEGTCT